MAARTSTATVPLLFTLLLALLLAPGPVAAAESGTMSASSVHVAQGTLVGPLAGASWTLAGEERDPVADLASEPRVVEAPAFFLSARQAVVTVHHSARTLSTPAGSPLPADAPAPDRWSLANVTARGAVGDSDALRFVALPSEGTLLSVEPSELALRPASTAGQAFTPRTETEPFGFTTETALEAVLPSTGVVRVEGSFRVVLTGLDLVLRSDDGERVLHTREDAAGYVEAPGPAYARRTVVHEAFVDLEDAVVVFPADGVYLERGTLESDGAWSIADAHGVLHVAGPDHDLRGDDVALKGDLTAIVARRGGSVATTLFGAIDGLQVGDQAVALDGTSNGAPAPSDWLAVAILPLALLLAAVHIAVGRHRFGRLDRAMDRRDYEGALAIARRFGLHPRLQEDAALAQAVCLLALERPALAVKHLDGRPRWAPHRRATRDFLAARAEAALGNGEAALRRLAASLAANPALAPEAHVDPVLSPLLRSLWPAPQEAYA